MTDATDQDGDAGGRRHWHGILDAGGGSRLPRSARPDSSTRPSESRAPIRSGCWPGWTSRCCSPRTPR
ncbi:hypothetical protein GXW82_09365 [Streptacidiphilus sp. 4-A2]|nr:hypothetical protein [Streptacidiphilus sp. 4-A2]